MSKRATIRLDRSASSIVITCADCPHWRSLQLSEIEAWRSAAGHEQNCHPSSTRARNSLQTFATRRGIRP